MDIAVNPDSNSPPTGAHALPSDSLLDRGPLSRREALARAAMAVAAAGGVAALLAGCATSSEVTALPEADWPAMPMPPAPPAQQAPILGWNGQINPRSAWAKGSPMAARMDRMQPVRRITLHHTAIPAGSVRSTNDAARMIEQVRIGHINRRGEPFGDIGYHYIIDPKGGVWEGRSLQWQGAHVAKQNEGNLGIVCLGNFETERPSPAQIAALNAFVVAQMRRFNVALRDVRTHREMAPTACPGKNLQPIINTARGRGGLMAMG